MRKRTEEYKRNGKKETRVVEYTALASACAKHAQVVAAPEKRLDVGGADAYARTACGVDAFEIARRREHADVEAVLADVEAARLAREAALRQAPIDEQLAKQRALEAEARAKHGGDEPRRGREAPHARGGGAPRQRAAEERAWKRLGIVPTRRTKWKGITIDVDERRGIGYFPRSPRDPQVAAGPGRHGRAEDPRAENPRSRDAGARALSSVMDPAAFVASARKSTLYELLGASSTDENEALRKAYRRRSLQFHPDKHAGDDSATEAFLIISRAYEILSDDEARLAYDVKLAREARVRARPVPRARTRSAARRAARRPTRPGPRPTRRATPSSARPRMAAELERYRAKFDSGSRT
ncbi:hypothetical protein JL721_6192 [Aureococcus anophagefferens]|nr:hypothetical protein JL721_6192 [Aureococcus anophagefferens]